MSAVSRKLYRVLLYALDRVLLCALAGCAVCGLAALVLSYLVRPVNHGRTTDMCMFNIAIALRDYERAWGSLPLDPRGSEAALYMLYPAYLDNFRAFNCPGTMGQATYDEKNRKISGADYIYLNSRDHRKYDTNDPTTPLIWERPDLRKDGGYVYLMSNTTIWLKRNEFKQFLEKWGEGGSPRDAGKTEGIP